MSTIIKNTPVTFLSSDDVEDFVNDVAAAIDYWAGVASPEMLETAGWAFVGLQEKGSQLVAQMTANRTHFLAARDATSADLLSPFSNTDPRNVSG